MSRFQRIHLLIHAFFAILFIGLLFSIYFYNTEVYAGQAGVGIGLAVFAAQVFRILQVVFAILFVVYSVLNKSIKSKSFYLILMIILVGQILGYLIVR